MATCHKFLTNVIIYGDHIIHIHVFIDNQR